MSSLMPSLNPRDRKDDLFGAQGLDSHDSLSGARAPVSGYYPSADSSFPPTYTSTYGTSISSAPARPSDRGRAKGAGYMAAMGLGVGTMMAETVLSHPWVVLRRQCQVHGAAISHHTTPFSLFPIVFNLQQNQGVLCLWKGVSSSIVIHGLNAITERVLGDITRLPKEVTWHSTVQKVAKHFLLKTLTYGITTSFCAASLIETVQSDVIGERPAVLDCLKEGLARLSSDVLGPRDHRRIGVWYLLAPSTSYRLCHYIIHSITSYVMYSKIRRKMMAKPEKEKTVFTQIAPELYASFAANMMADTILYPFETVLHRIFLQGTRTIIDNLDSGSEVIPITTRYEGWLDGVRSIFGAEGLRGFYRGFGALVAQYLVHLAILRLTQFLMDQLEDVLRPDDPSPYPTRSQILAAQASATDPSYGGVGNPTHQQSGPPSVSIAPGQRGPPTYPPGVVPSLPSPSNSSVRSNATATTRSGMASFPGYDNSALLGQK